MATPMNGAWVRELIARRHGSVDALVAAWEARVTRGEQRSGSSRDRSTLHRWLKQGIPTTSGDDLFGLAAALDVDPIVLVDLSDAALDEHFVAERRLFQMGSPVRTPLSPLRAIFFPGPEWPARRIAGDFYGRDWCVHPLASDVTTEVNVYAALVLTTPPDVMPRAYHFAYRRRAARDRMWRPFGTVVVDAGTAVLVSESGDRQERPAGQRAGETIVETYFGPETSEFRVASLHDFTLAVSVPSDREGAVRFKA